MNPAHRLAATLATIRVAPPGVSTAKTRHDVDTEQAYRDYLWTVDALRRIGDAGADISHYRDAAKDWERMVLSAGSWDASVSQERASGDQSSIFLLRSFADVAATSRLFAHPDRAAVARLAATAAEARRIVEEADLADGFKIPMLGALDQIDAALAGYPSVDVAEATAGAALLLGYMTILAESGRADAPAWRERAAETARGIFAGLAANAAYAALGFAVGLLGG